MILNKVIFSCDDNPNYTPYWKLTSEICRKKLGVTPVLIRITKQNSELYEDDYGDDCLCRSC